MLNKYIIANLTLVIIASTISAFDGKREGTIFGIGGGIAPYGNSTVFLPDVYSQGRSPTACGGILPDESMVPHYSHGLFLCHPSTGSG